MSRTLYVKYNSRQIKSLKVASLLTKCNFEIQSSREGLTVHKYKLKGVSKQIDKFHKPRTYYITKSKLREWQRKKAWRFTPSTVTPQTALVLGKRVDKGIADVLNRNATHYIPVVYSILAAIKTRGYLPLVSQLPVTNFTRTEAASVALIDIVAYNMIDKRYTVIELKTTSKHYDDIMNEHERARINVTTGYKKSFYSKAMLQAQIGALMLTNTYNIDNADVDAVVVFHSFRDSSTHVNHVGLMHYGESFPWILGYKNKTSTSM